MNLFDIRRMDTALALLCRCLAWFPLWLLLLMLRSPQKLLPGCGILFLCCCIAAVSARALPRTAKYLLLTLLAAGGAFLLHLVCGGIVIPLLAAIPSVFGAAAGADQDAEELFTFSQYTISLTCTVLADLLLHLAELTVPQPFLLSVCGGFSLLYFLLRNQVMLHRMVNRRSTYETDVPADIRRGNLMMAGGVFLLILLGFLFREQLLAGLLALRDLLVWLLRTLLRMITLMIAKLAGNAPEAPDTQAPEHSALQTEGGRSPLWLLLWIPFAAVMIFFWHMLLRDWLFDLRETLSALLHRHDMQAAEESAPQEARAYTDTETLLRPRRSSRKLHRKWKRAYQAWKAMPDSPEKFDQGYQLLLTAPAWEKGALSPADTPQEICEKWQNNYLPQQALHAVTQELHAAHYAETGLPAQSCKDMEAALETLRRHGKLNDA